MSSRSPPARAPTRRRIRSVSCLLLAVALGACRGGKPAPLSYDGSRTLAQYLMAELIPGYEAASGDRFGPVGIAGSSEGFRAVMDGRAVLGGVARPLRTQERLAEPYYAIVGYDALAVFVHPDNPLDGLTRAQLKEVFTGKVKNWKELGGRDAPLELLFEEPQLEHGLTDIFRDEVLEGTRFGPGEVCHRSESCLDELSRRPNAVTFASVARAQSGVRSIAVEGQWPDGANVRSGEYLLSRPLLLLTKAAPRDNLKLFFDYALSPEGQAQVAQHFIPAWEGR